MNKELKQDKHARPLQTAVAALLPKGWTMEKAFVVRDEQGNLRGCASHEGVALLMAMKSFEAKNNMESEYKTTIIRDGQEIEITVFYEWDGLPEIMGACNYETGEDIELTSDEYSDISTDIYSSAIDYACDSMQDR